MYAAIIQLRQRHFFYLEFALSTWTVRIFVWSSDIIEVIESARSCVKGSYSERVVCLLFLPFSFKMWVIPLLNDRIRAVLSLLISGLSSSLLLLSNSDNLNSDFSFWGILKVLFLGNSWSFSSKSFMRSQNPLLAADTHESSWDSRCFFFESFAFLVWLL